jgi:hypothetical protein
MNEWTGSDEIVLQNPHLANFKSADKKKLRMMGKRVTLSIYYVAETPQRVPTPGELHIKHDVLTSANHLSLDTIPSPILTILTGSKTSVCLYLIWQLHYFLARFWKGEESCTLLQNNYRTASGLLSAPFLHMLLSNNLITITETSIRRKSSQRVSDTSDYRTNETSCFVSKTELPVFAHWSKKSKIQPFLLHSYSDTWTMMLFAPQSSSVLLVQRWSMSQKRC